MMKIITIFIYKTMKDGKINSIKQIIKMENKSSMMMAKLKKIRILMNNVKINLIQIIEK